MRPGAPPPAGFPRWAWWTLFLATFTFAVPLTSPWWSTVLRSEIPGAAEEDAEGAPAGSAEGVTPQVPETGSTLKVVLHLRSLDQSQPALATVEREIPYVRGVIPQIQAAVSELAVASPEAAALLPAGTRVLDVAFTPGGTVYIDFSPEIDAGRAIGADEERMIVQGIVTTVTSNFTAVRRVILLVDGKSPRALHLDLSRPLRADDPVFAAEPPPEPSVSPTSSPAPSPAPPAPPPAGSQPSPKGKP